MTGLRISAMVISVLTGLGLVAGPAGATTIENGSALSNAAATIDFSGLANLSAISAPIDGVTFSGFYVTDQFDDGTGHPRFNGSSGAVATNFPPPRGAPNPTVTLNFSTPQTDVSFFFVTSGVAAETITSFLNGAVVETIADVSNSVTGGIYGFTGSLFDSISISGDEAQGPAILIDNLQLSSVDVPEPASASVLLAGVAGLAAVRRRRG